MLTTQQCPRSVLAYGRDELLLYTRLQLIEIAGFEGIAVGNLKDFRNAVASSTSPFTLFVMCHTAGQEEIEEVRQIALGTGTFVYVPEVALSPEAFVTQIRELMTPTGAV